MEGSKSILEENPYPAESQPPLFRTLGCGGGTRSWALDWAARLETRGPLTVFKKENPRGNQHPPLVLLVKGNPKSDQTIASPILRNTLA